MPKESQMRLLSEKLLNATMASLAKRPLPSTGHQAAQDLYNALDLYTDAINHNQQAAAKSAIEKLAVETLRVAAAYDMPAAPSGVDSVRVENTTAAKREKV
jgi:hypothetical protein